MVYWVLTPLPLKIFSWLPPTYCFVSFLTIFLIFFGPWSSLISLNFFINLSCRVKFTTFASSPHHWQLCKLKHPSVFMPNDVSMCNPSDNDSFIVLLLLDFSRITIIWNTMVPPCHVNSTSQSILDHFGTALPRYRTSYAITTSGSASARHFSLHIKQQHKPENKC